MKIKTIIIAIICIILPYSAIANQTNAKCKEYGTADACWAIAGCEYSGSGDGQGNAGCKACSISLYCTGIANSPSSCPTPTLDCAEEAKCSTNGYLFSGLESADECIQYTLLKITLPQAYYFEAPSTLNPNDKAYKTKKCSNQTFNGRTYSGKPENADKENSSLTIRELTNNYSLQDRCILCEENQVPNDNGIGCKDKKPISCNAGQYFNTEGECADCAKGTFQPIDGYMGYSCTTCPEGTYQHETGKSSCNKCDAGTYNPNKGSTTKDACIACDAGTYQAEEGQSSCNKCDAGTHNPKKGSTTDADCIACDQGKYQDEEGQAECKTCEPGTVSDISLDGMTKCKPCTGSWYQDQPGKSTCIQCPPLKIITTNPAVCETTYPTSETPSKSITDCKIELEVGKDSYLKAVTGDYDYECLPCDTVHEFIGDTYTQNYNSTKELYPFATTQCTEIACPDNSTPNRDSTATDEPCECNKGYHDSKSTTGYSDVKVTTEGKGGTCTINTYDIVYTVEQCPSNNLTFNTYKETREYTTKELPLREFTGYECPGHTINGWIDKKDFTRDTIKISTEAESLAEDNTIHLKATWTAKQFDVFYYKYYNNDSNNELLKEGQRCEYGNSTCKAMSADETQANVDGHLFNAWSCKYKKGKNETLTDCDCPQNDKGICEIEPGDDISTMSEGNDILLIASFTQCSAGYYCSANTEKACPAGSTTEVAATSITDCYMVGDDITRICSNNGGKDSGYNACFYLPGDVKKLFYKGTKSQI